MTREPRTGDTLKTGAGTNAAALPSALATDVWVPEGGRDAGIESSGQQQMVKEGS